VSSHIKLSAKKLLKNINLPAGVVNVLPISDENGSRLLVWLDPLYFKKADFIPANFDGFPVNVELRPVAIGF